MTETTANPVIESSLWAYKVSSLLLYSLLIKILTHISSVKATDVVKLDEASLKEAAKRVGKFTIPPSSPLS